MWRYDPHDAASMTTYILPHGVSRSSQQHAYGMYELPATVWGGGARATAHRNAAAARACRGRIRNVAGSSGSNAGSRGAACSATAAFGMLTSSVGRFRRWPPPRPLPPAAPERSTGNAMAVPPRAAPVGDPVPSGAGLRERLRVCVSQVERWVARAGEVVEGVPRVLLRLRPRCAVLCGSCTSDLHVHRHEWPQCKGGAAVLYGYTFSWAAGLGHAWQGTSCGLTRLLPGSGCQPASLYAAMARSALVMS